MSNYSVFVHYNCFIRIFTILSCVTVNVPHQAIEVGGRRDAGLQVALSDAGVVWRGTRDAADVPGRPARCGRGGRPRRMQRLPIGQGGQGAAMCASLGEIGFM
jgi:hypothetical protein